MTTDEGHPSSQKTIRVLWAFVAAIWLGTGWFHLMMDAALNAHAEA